MRKLEARYLAFVVALAIVLVLLLFSFLGVSREGRSVAKAPDRGTDDVAVGAAPSFTISGDITGEIRPGVLLPLDLSLENPNNVDLSVDKITVSVRTIHAPQATVDLPCTAADFEVRQIGGGVAALRLGAKGEQKLSQLDVVPQQRPALGMLNRPINQDGCKGASLTLHYSAAGQQAVR